MTSEEITYGRTHLDGDLAPPSNPFWMLSPELRSIVESLPDPDEPRATTMRCHPGVRDALGMLGGPPRRPSFLPVAPLVELAGIPIVADPTMSEHEWRIVDQNGNTMHEGRFGSDPQALGDEITRRMVTVDNRAATFTATGPAYFADEPTRTRSLDQVLADIDEATDAWERIDGARWTPDLLDDRDDQPVAGVPVEAGSTYRFNAVFSSVSINGVDLTPYVRDIQLDPDPDPAGQQQAWLDSLPDGQLTISGYFDGFDGGYTIIDEVHTWPPGVMRAWNDLKARHAKIVADYRRALKRIRMRYLHTSYSAKKRGHR